MTTTIPHLPPHHTPDQACPTAALPFEVVAYIFQNVRAEMTLDFDDGEEVPNVVDTLFAILQVCRRWRDIALGCPSLWNWIALEPRRMPNFEHSANRAERSKATLLDLYIWDRLEVEDAAPFILPHIGRWGRLSFFSARTSGGHNPEIANPVIPWILSLRLPRVFSIAFRDDDVVSDFMTLVDVPNLTDLACRDSTFVLPIPTAGTKLEFLEMRHTWLEKDYLNNAFTVIQNSSSTLRLVDIASGWGDLDLPSVDDWDLPSVLSYPLLERLCIDGQLWSIFGTAHLPSLGNLEVVVSKEWGVIDKGKRQELLAVRSLVWRHGRPYGSMPDARKQSCVALLQDVLIACPNLTFLDMAHDSPPTPEELLVLIVTNDGRRPKFCPFLRDIYLPKAPVFVVRALIGVRHELIRIKLRAGADEDWKQVERWSKGFGVFMDLFRKLEEEVRGRVVLEIPAYWRLVYGR